MVTRSICPDKLKKKIELDRRGIRRTVKAGTVSYFRDAVLEYNTVSPANAYLNSF